APPRRRCAAASAAPAAPASCCATAAEAADAVCSLHSLDLLPPPLATELGFTRVRSPLSGRSQINPTSAGGLGRGGSRTHESCRMPPPYPSPVNGGGDAGAARAPLW